MNFKGVSSGVKSFTEIQNKDHLSPCQYTTERIIDKVKPDYSKRCLKIYPSSKHEKNFIDIAARLKRDVPAPGMYGMLDRVQDKISKGASPRYKRGV